MFLDVQVEVSPLENAIYVVENKTQELRTLISQYQHRQHHGNINPLSMCLNGVIDAAVNGGIARYQEVERKNETFGFIKLVFGVLHLLTPLQQAFFDKDYISSHPEDAERITHLKDLMQEQVRLSFEARCMQTCCHNSHMITSLSLPVTGAHSRSGAGRSREAGAPRDASPAQKACRPVPHDEDRFTSCEYQVLWFEWG